MNILFISHYAGSPDMGMVFRPYYFAKEWIRLGHSVTIITSSFTHIRKTNPSVLHDFEESKIDGITYVWIKTPQYRKTFGRVFNIFTFVFKLKSKVKQIAEKYHPNIVISSSTYNFDIFSAIKIARYSNAKLVYEVRDLWPLTPIELGGYSKYHPFIILMQYAENTAYKKADSVVSVLPVVHEYMKNHGLDLKKLLILPNGILTDMWLDSCISSDSISSDIRLCYEIQKEIGNIIVGYIGSFGKMYSLDAFIEAAYILKEKKVGFMLVGSGEQYSSLIEKVKSYDLKNVFIFEPIEKSHIPLLLSLFDIGYVGFLYKNLFRFGVSPNKMMDYMMAGKPIINAIKAGNDPVMNADCGITVEPENPKAIADGILKLAALSPEARDEMGRRGRDYILKNQTYDILAKNFLDFVTKDN
ncbi:MAG: glycosyltransferase family 4 protein [Treponema phagedenis]|uniref:glycosyltransferase family 4 protein n=1 Tax=Treponema phagedenis TaxID=162 RepID=UPI0031340609